MPRKGKAILLDAREASGQYGWTDENLAAVHAARDAGWTLQEIADVLGCTREYVRQLYEKESDPTCEVTGFPEKPKRPQAPQRIPVNVLRRRLVSSGEIQELVDLQRVAKRRRSNGNPATVAAAEELWRRVNDLVNLGVSSTWLSQQMGLSSQTLNWGLVRYGYRDCPPSQSLKVTGGGQHD
ncbi:sigma factor-like helix-turn-helix DNA-binding protein [Mycolicibacterium bacteremicum]|uniref:RNA polymerase sigma-70 region 4 domain-containing protein n=1 Tax=Mycolicibacterium bacteremicum TaxID=564198 RepID=A0A1W9YQ52_MYCBA|nr:helix-turn-helix domain-containing protein [Mycolicibacterium bacteremicum]ORA02154.1 hypothetical protein BST17_24910 [Mycolicibacterium bacteremicum]